MADALRPMAWEDSQIISVFRNMMEHGAIYAYQHTQVNKVYPWRVFFAYGSEPILFTTPEVAEMCRGWNLARRYVG